MIMSAAAAMPQSTKEAGADSRSAFWAGSGDVVRLLERQEQ